MKRLVCLLLFIFILTGFCFNVTAKTFSDSQAHWAKDDIAILYYTRISEGFSNSKESNRLYENLFYPDRDITRAELATLISRSLNYSYEVSRYYYSLKEIKIDEFNDVNKNDWFYEDVMQVKKAGIMKGFSDKTFKPNKQLTREEVAQIVINYIELVNKYRDEIKRLPKGKVTEKYIDDSNISDWAKSAIYSLPTIEGSNGNIALKKFVDGSFKPKEFMTRGEAAVIMVYLSQMRDQIDYSGKQIESIYDLEFGLGGTYSEVKINLKNKKMYQTIYEHTDGKRDPTAPNEGYKKVYDLAQDKINNFYVDVQKCHVGKWYDDYESKLISDGDCKDVIITYTDSTVKKVYIRNAYPPQWDDLAKVLKDLTGQDILVKYFNDDY